MIGAVEASTTEIYEAVVALSRSIAGRSDLESLLSGVARIGSPNRRLRLRRPDSARSEERRDAGSFPEQAWKRHRKPLRARRSGSGRLGMAQSAAARNRFVSSAETRWPAFRDRVRSSGVNAVTLVPLTAGDNRLGAFGFGCLAPYEPSPRRTGIPGAGCQRVRRRGRVLPRQAGSSPGAGPLADAIRHHECAGVEAVYGRVVLCHFGAALKRDPSTISP